MNAVRISNTNSSGKNSSAVRVYANDRLVSELIVNKRNPLGYLQTLSASKYHVELCDDLTSAMQNGDCSLEQANHIKKSVFPRIHN